LKKVFYTPLKARLFSQLYRLIGYKLFPYTACLTYQNHASTCMQIVDQQQYSFSYRYMRIISLSKQKKGENSIFLTQQCRYKVPHLHFALAWLLSYSPVSLHLCCKYIFPAEF